jgi:hypothetical protein
VCWTGSWSRQSAGQQLNSQGAVSACLEAAAAAAAAAAVTVGSCDQPVAGVIPAGSTVCWFEQAEERPVTAVAVIAAPLASTEWRKLGGSSRRTSLTENIHLGQCVQQDISCVYQPPLALHGVTPTLVFLYLPMLCLCSQGV